MWTISMLKRNAKTALKNYFWIAFFVSLIFIVLTGGGTSTAGRSAYAGFENDIDTTINEYYSEYSSDADSYDDTDIFNPDGLLQEDMDQFYADLQDVYDNIIDFVIAFAIISLIIGLFYNLLFANTLKVGYNRFFLDGRVGMANTSNLFSSFKKGYYKASVKNMFIMQLKLWAWSLISIIPCIVGIIIVASTDYDAMTSDVAYTSLVGVIVLTLVFMFIALIPKIIKKYEYFLVPYITTDNPEIPVSRAFQISRETMRGEKGHCFGLTLSFIGWFILAAFVGFSLALFAGDFFSSIIATLCITFVYPYLHATYAEFYCCMREKALATGVSSRDELNGLFGHAPVQTPDYPEQNVYQQSNSSVNSNGTYPASQTSETINLTKPTENSTNSTDSIVPTDTSIDDFDKKDNDDYTDSEIK